MLNVVAVFFMYYCYYYYFCCLCKVSKQFTPSLERTRGPKGRYK